MKAFLLIVFCCVVNFGGWANVGAEFSSKDYDGDNDWGSDNSGSNSECYDADIKEFPFTAALYYNHEFICSATIITRYLAVTPAFCIQDKSYILMDLSVGKTHPSPDEGIHITQAIKHPHFNPRTGDYDIAVLIFERIAFNETIKPMLLLNWPFRPVPTGTPVKIATWGHCERNGTGEESLQVIHKNLMDVKECQKMYIGKRIIHPTRMYCIAANWTEPCSQESGSPLVTNNSTTGLGIASNRFQCPPRDLPSVYISLNERHIRKFIDDMIKQYADLTVKGGPDNDFQKLNKIVPPTFIQNDPVEEK